MMGPIHDGWTYDVFINFRGEDVRYGFIGHLNQALKQKGVSAFFDDREIGVGDEITPALLKAIQESRTAITVFSKEYASSTFCLDELVQIHQCLKGNGRLVRPIFYDVEPSEVRHQKGKYGDALDTHKKNSRADEARLESWKHALREVANLKGSSYDPRKGYEHKLVEEIVNHMLSIIKRVPLYVAKYPVGLNSRLQSIKSLLQLGSNDEVTMIGICGTGGIGKTTIARALYNEIADNFDYLCFLDDITGESGKHGLQQEQARMLSRILGQKIEIGEINQGLHLIKRMAKDKKVLLILDNVDEREQLEMLAGECEWFGSGSRIIITTRDLRLLKRHGVERIYEMEVLNHEESVELLSWMAFKNMQFDPRYTQAVENVTSYADGLPLALEVIGSDLCGKDASQWESMLDGCKGIPLDKIQRILKVSYDGLNKREKEVFLDIACFYNGCQLNHVKKMVASVHDFDPDYHIGVLEDKCLIKTGNHAPGAGHVTMHDLVEDMGKEIVRQESSNDPGKRSRLWSSKDILRVLKKSEGTNEVMIIIQVERLKCIAVVDWDGEAFKSMNSLKILVLENADISQAPKYLPDSLAVFIWRGYPSSCLPPGFCPDDLVEFHVRESRFSSTEIINETMRNVTVLNFKGCKCIGKIPNISGLSRLKELLLSDCQNLTEIDDSVGQLPKLGALNASNCSMLETFPLKLNTPSLRYLGLDNCRNLKTFPEIETREMKISQLRLLRTGIDGLHPSVENLAQLGMVRIEALEGIRSMKLPSSTFLLPKLSVIAVERCEELLMEVGPIRCPNMRTLELTRCNISNENLGIYLTSFSNVRALDLSGSSDFTVLPACIQDCQNLADLVLDGCRNLILVEKLPPVIARLTARDCTSLSSESRKLLLSKELLASVVPINGETELPTEAYLCVPGRSIPEWFDHCSKGSSISFWFRDHNYCLPTLCVCAIHKPTKRHHDRAKIQVFINDKMALEKTPLGRTRYCEDHIAVCYVWDLKLLEFVERGRHWNQLKIRLTSSGLEDGVKESGIYVVSNERTKMENIRFTDPFQSEQQYTHSHPLIDIDSLRRLSALCKRLTFPIFIDMHLGIVGSSLEYVFYITKQDLLEFLSMQDLCVTIIQLFVRLSYSICSSRGIGDRFGFLCPEAVQSVGRTREDRISYIGSTIKEGNKKQCWLAPIREGNHWTLCAICPESKAIYWFDSLGGQQSYDIEKVFTEALERYQIIGENSIKWLRPNYRRQLKDKECGYYIMRYMCDIIDLNQVHSLDTHFNNPQCYSQEDIDFIRKTLSAYILDIHVPKCPGSHSRLAVLNRIFVGR